MPSLIYLTAHADIKRHAEGFTTEMIAQAVLLNHSTRRRNPGSSDWLIREGSLVVVYNWPHEGDPETALVVTVYRDR